MPLLSEYHFFGNPETQIGMAIWVMVLLCVLGGRIAESRGETFWRGVILCGVFDAFGVAAFLLSDAEGAATWLSGAALAGITIVLVLPESKNAKLHNASRKGDQNATRYPRNDKERRCANCSGPLTATEEKCSACGTIQIPDAPSD